MLLSRFDSIPYLAEISAAYSGLARRDQARLRAMPRALCCSSVTPHAAVLPRLESLTLENRATRHTVIFRTRGGCAPVPGIERLGYGCARFVDETFALARKPEIQT